jgi:hypothetical protein
MWSLVEEWTSQNFLVAASICHAGGEAEHRRPDGLIEQHAYSVLTSIGVGDFMLIKLRNPWGSDAEWRGAWSDNSDLWQRHANIAEALDFRKAADGIFWMDWHDFSATFNSLEVSHKRMRTGPGESNRAAWRSLQRVRAPDQPAPQTPAPQTLQTQTQYVKMDQKQQISEAIALSLQEQQISAVIALSIHELGAANARPLPHSSAPPSALPSVPTSAPPSSGPAELHPDASLLFCPLHGATCPYGPFENRTQLRRHVNRSLDDEDAERSLVSRTVIRSVSRAPRLAGIDM